MSKPDCLFCDFENPDRHNLIEQNDLAYARWDNFPVSEGHAEIVPKRHIDSFFDLSQDELTAMYGLAKTTKGIIVAKYKPDARCFQSWYKRRRSSRTNNSSPTFTSNTKVRR